MKEYLIRPSGRNMQRDMMGLYERQDENSWKEIYTGTYFECANIRDKIERNTK